MAQTQKAGSHQTVVFVYEFYETNTKLYLFGKKKEEEGWKSCSLCVEEHLAKLYLPKSTLTPELETKLKNRRIVVSETNKLLFNSDTPQPCIEVTTSFNVDLNKMLGVPLLNEFTQTESIILSKRIHGPSYLSVAARPQTERSCFTKLEYVVKAEELRVEESIQAADDKNTELSSIELPPLSVITIALGCDKNRVTGVVVQHLNYQNSRYDVLSSYSCSTLQEKDAVHVQSEGALLSYLVALFQKCDPDVVACHGVERLEEVLLRKHKEYPVIALDKLGRVSKRTRSIFNGRLVLDTQLLAKEYLKLRSYDVEAINSALFDRSEEERPLLAEVSVVLKLAERLDALNLTFCLSKVSGSPWRSALHSSNSERSEYVFMHELYSRGYAVPRNTNPERKSYEGGLVLEPALGIHHNVYLFDFMSLYPSLIREYSICPTRSSAPVLPKIVARLVEQRQELKRRLRLEDDDQRRRMLDVLQTAVKLTANSLYGMFGYVKSRFYCVETASQITERGRDTLRTTAKFVEERLSVSIVYGDTDSIMLVARDAQPLDPQTVLCLINREDSHLKLEYEKLFSKIIIYSKKKYAAKCGEQLEFKGIDVVRRDWCELSSETCLCVLDVLFAEQSDTERLTKVLAILKDTADNEHPLSKYVLTKALSKEIAAYETDPAREGVVDTQPHIAVARRAVKYGHETYRAGDVVSYVVSRGKGTVTERSFSVSEFLKRGLEVDKEYYLKSQVYPPVMRLCTYLRGATSHVLMLALGLVDAQRTVPKLLDYVCSACGAHNSLGNNFWQCGKCSANSSLASHRDLLMRTIDNEVNSYYTYRRYCAVCDDVYCHTWLDYCLVCRGALTQVANAQRVNDLILDARRVLRANGTESTPGRSLTDSDKEEFEGMERYVDWYYERSDYINVDVGALFLD